MKPFYVLADSSGLTLLSPTEYRRFVQDLEGAHHMATRATICADLADRIARYKARYKADPPHLPITLDELAWLADAVSGPITQETPMPVQYGGIVLKLVEQVLVGPTGQVVVRP